MDETFLRAIRLKRDAVEDFDCYPFAIPAVRQLEELRRRVAWCG